MMRWQVFSFVVTSLLFLQHYFYGLSDPAPTPAEHISLLTDEHLLKTLNQYSTHLGELLWPLLTERNSEAEVLEIVGTLKQLQDLVAEAQILEGLEGDKIDVIMSPSDDVIMSPSDDVIMPFRAQEPPNNGSCPNTETFLVEMKRRRELLNTHCEKESPDVRSKISTLNKYIYFKKQKLSYCPSFKSASTNVLAHFCLDYHSSEECHAMKGFRLYQTRSFLVPSHPKGSRFVAVRHPLKRLLSAYRDKIEHFRFPYYIEMVKKMMVDHRRVLCIKYPIKARSKLCDTALEHAATIHANTLRERSAFQQVTLSDSNPYDHPPYPTFAEFVSAVLMGTDNSHWHPYTQACGPCGPHKLDFILRSEELECELHSMLDFTNNSALIQTYHESWATNSNHHTDPTLFYRYYSTLTDDQLEGLGEYYRLDCEFYEYDCVEELSRINLFKLANPGYKHLYNESWDRL